MLRALEAANAYLRSKQKGAVNMPLFNERIYTIEDIYSLPEGERAELLDGRIYSMSPPSTRHQIQNGLYSFDDEIPVAIYPGFSIRISDLLE